MHTMHINQGRIQESQKGGHKYILANMREAHNLACKACQIESEGIFNGLLLAWTTSRQHIAE